MSLTNGKRNKRRKMTLVCRVLETPGDEWITMDLNHSLLFLPRFLMFSSLTNFYFWSPCIIIYTHNMYTLLRKSDLIVLLTTSIFGTWHKPYRWHAFPTCPFFSPFSFFSYINFFFFFFNIMVFFWDLHFLYESTKN